MTYLQHLVKAVTEPSFVFFCVFGFGVYLLIYVQEEWEGVRETCAEDNVVTFIRFAPICLLVIIIMGGISHLDKANPGQSRKIIAGEYGEVTAALTASIMPGGAGGDPLKQAWESGKDRGSVIFCLVAMMALSLNAFMFRAGYLGWKLSLIYASIGVVLLLQVYFVTKLLKPWL